MYIIGLLCSKMAFQKLYSENYTQLPYNGNHPRKKSFANFANLEAFADVFLHFLSLLEFLYMRLPES